MKQYFKFQGTATRSEYWAVNIISYLGLMLVALIGALFISINSVGVAIGALMIFFGVVITAFVEIATTIRRCRDAGINPWFTAAVFIPYIGVIPWIVIGCLSTQKENQDG